jgi:hypothetical protein
LHHPKDGTNVNQTDRTATELASYTQFVGQSDV